MTISAPQRLTALRGAKKRFLDKLEMTGWVGDDEKILTETKNNDI
jgi:hypothetical protein